MTVSESVSVGDMYELRYGVEQSGCDGRGYARGSVQGVSGRCDWELAPGAAAQEYKLVGSASSARGNVVVRLLHMTPSGD